MPTSGAFDSIKFVYEYADGYRLYPANGMVGGLTPKGDLRVDFYVEAFAIPASVTQAIKPNGELGAELRREPEGDGNTAVVKRHIQLAVLIPGSQIDSFAVFLAQKAIELKGLMKGQEDAPP